ncbi:MAG TPA: hemerythrin domain-containing protein [Dehalococcoidia bacterium]|nr:hemerythrin domain-containing protein [Dehalococcoidia bacterium]
MAEGPISGIRFIHAAIRREAEEIEALAHRPDVDLATLAERIRFLERISEVHTSGEEEHMLTLLEEKVPRVAEAYTVDHADEDTLFDELKDLIDGFQYDAADADRRLARIRRQTIALVEHLRGHVNKEERLLVPLLNERCSIEEQIACVEGIVSHIPREDMPTLFPWIINALDEDQAAAFASLTLESLPPSVQQASREWVRNGVSPEKWASLSRRVPQWA